MPKKDTKNPESQNMPVVETAPRRKKFLVFLIIAVIVIPSAAALYFYESSRKISKSPNAAASKETAALTASIGKIIMLPEGEEPALATVLNKEKLASEPFFKNALNGDKVLIFYAARKAILYRPAINKIIEVAPLAVAQPVAPPSVNNEKGQ